MDHSVYYLCTIEHCIGITNPMIAGSSLILPTLSAKSKDNVRKMNKHKNKSIYNILGVLNKIFNLSCMIMSDTINRQLLFYFFKSKLSF